MQLISNYYEAFNRADMDTFFQLMDDHIIHEINQGEKEIGKIAFQKFMHHMNHCYREKVTDLVILVNADGTRAAAEFIVEGIYIATDPGLPLATQQAYHLPAGAFFSIHSGKITRITNYYNIKRWIKLISQPQGRGHE